MTLDVGVAFLVDRRRARPGRDAIADEPRDRERPQVLPLVGQVAEALAEEDRRSERAE